MHRMNNYILFKFKQNIVASLVMKTKMVRNYYGSLN